MAAAPVRERLMQMFAAAPDGLTDGSLSQTFGMDMMQQHVLPILNSMMQANRLNSMALDGGGILFRVVEEQVAAKLQGLSPEMMMVYHEVERAGNNGVSSGDIKKKTNIQQNTVTKATKELDRRCLIKRVKSIHQKTQKIWMLYDLMPSANITGGPWYTDNEFDHEFVNEICKIAESLIKEQWEANSLPTSLQQVDRRVASSGVSQEALSLDHVRQILNRLVFDSKVEEMTLSPYLRSVSSDDGPFYRSTQQALTHYDRFTALPCGVCPVFDQCAPGGVVSPETCVYLPQWWADDGTAHAMDEAVLDSGDGGGGGGGAAEEAPSGGAPTSDVEDLF